MSAQFPRKVIVLLEESTVEQQRIFLEWVKGKGMGWAHWFVGGWLLAIPGPIPTVQEIVDQLGTMTPSPQCIAFEISDPLAWQGTLNSPSVAGAKNWLMDQWHLRGILGS
jgi:hypothetical protein